MLQWMGGSRRKVAASHTSVKKRQKQYFEQRRQQQHQQLTVGSERCPNDINSSNQHPREHHSMDILNLLNLSTATPECNTITDVMDASLSYRTSFSLPDNQTNEFKKANTTTDLLDGTEWSK
ncbi:PREDICTED: uncharacterized protein LOC104786119 isoform X3 [Camelina sativa]|uniref:Uncharacterized protein LOC104786119 isoform X1 n=1 Tax=Camelina sativa TaxID=90675 RepID=A0ABM0Z350_CAMSA|nr:PREDICTED: uncharacterized protein LOC104786119 isoform X1 [Camelina sativa]XP_010509754.1 PREDICTED: uncharacterized protein LOC104786119 isoform X2 [Camelina sativa]XP_010509755.1 PREDICTED: uncharacterized protein LOC104786119 isoform X3 [Camelina sativa]